MKIWLLFAILLGIYTNDYAQSSFAIYKVVSSVGAEKIGFLSELRVTYDVWADSNFVEIVGVEDTVVVSGADSKLNANPSQEHIIISIKDSIVFHLQKSFFVYIKY